MLKGIVFPIIAATRKVFVSGANVEGGYLHRAIMGRVKGPRRIWINIHQVGLVGSDDDLGGNVLRIASQARDIVDLLVLE